MAVKGVLTILVGLAGIGVLAGFGLIAVNSARGRPARPGVVLAAIALVLLVILAPLNAGLVLIEPQERGVVFRQVGNAGLLPDALQPGLRWVVPFVDQVIEYDVAQQTVNMQGGFEQGGIPAGEHAAVRTISQDGQVILMDITVIYSVDPLKVNSVYREWRQAFENNFVVPQTRSSVRNAVTGFSAEEIYSGGRATMETQLFEELQAVMDAEGFILNDVLIRDISFSSQFTDAIEQKQIAEQQAQQAAFRVQQAEQEAEQARVEAQGQADAVVIGAEGDAEAIVLRAGAEAEALTLINEIIAENPQLIQYEYINQLGENVRLIVIPSNSPFLFDLESLLGQAGAETTTAPLPTPSAPPPAGDNGSSGSDDGDGLIPSPITNIRGAAQHRASLLSNPQCRGRPVWLSRKARTNPPPPTPQYLLDRSPHHRPP